MWKRTCDIFPGEWVGTIHELELMKELEIGDKAKVIVNSQFQDRYPLSEEKIPRCFEKIGTVIEINIADEWAYKLEFDDGSINWFKRYILEKIE